jgi:hypothetical protein
MTLVQVFLEEGAHTPKAQRGPTRVALQILSLVGIMGSDGCHSGQRFSVASCRMNSSSRTCAKAPRQPGHGFQDLIYRRINKGSANFKMKTALIFDVAILALKLTAIGCRNLATLAMKLLKAGPILRRADRGLRHEAIPRLPMLEFVEAC